MKLRLLVPLAIGFAVAPLVRAMPDEMALHLDENPPNELPVVSTTGSYRYTLVVPAPFGAHRSPAPTEEPMPLPLPVIEKLSPAVDAACGYDHALTALSEAGMREVLTAAGWPEEWHEEALRVSWGESNWCPAITNGIMLGLFQLSDRSANGWAGWWEYFGFDSARYAEPVYNAHLAWLVFSYEQEHGYARWSNWQVKP